MSHQKLIESLTEFYNTLAALHYIPATEIIHPPPGGHKNVDSTAAREQGFGDDMITLMQQLPYLSVECEDTVIAPASKPRSYLDDDFLDWARDPVFQGLNMTKATHLVLTNPGQYGTALIYDAESGTCTAWSPSTASASAEVKAKYGKQRAPDGLEYAHLPALPAETLLGQWTRNWISMRWLPYYEPNGWHLLVEEPSVSDLEQASKSPQLREKLQVALVQRSLKDVYVAAGWDVSAEDLGGAKRGFDGDVFEKKRLAWKKDTQALLDRAHGEKWAWVEIRKALNLPAESASLLDGGQQTRLKL